MRALTPNHWYLLFTCLKCKSKQILFQDLSSGKSEINATYMVEYDQCGHRGSYGSESIERYQHKAQARSA
jgi:hypothetical protein